MKPLITVFVCLCFVFPLFSGESINYKSFVVDNEKGSFIIHESEKTFSDTRQLFPELDDPVELWSYYYDGPICYSTAIACSSHILSSTSLNGATIDYFDIWNGGDPVFYINNADSLYPHADARVAAADDINRSVVIKYNGNFDDPLLRIEVYGDIDDNQEPLGVDSLDTGVWSGEYSKVIDFSKDGSRFAFGFVDRDLAIVTVKIYDALTCTEISTFTPPNENAGASRCVKISDDGSICSALFGGILYVWEVDGDILWEHDMGFSNDALGMSGDGRIVSYGWTGVYVYERVENEADYQLLEVIDPPGYCGELSVSGDGNYVVSAYYTGNYNQNVVYVYDTFFREEVWSYEYPVTNGPNQDLPSVVSVSYDGRWIAVGVWGDSDSDREICCFDLLRGPEPYFTYDMPGSVFSLDISYNGDIVSAAGKHVHANEFGRNGDLAALTLDTPGYLENSNWAYIIGENSSFKINTIHGYLDTLDIMDLPHAMKLFPDSRHAVVVGGIESLFENLYYYDILSQESNYLTEYGYYDVDLSPNERYIYVGGADGLTVYSVEIVDIIDSYGMNNENCIDIIVSPDGSVTGLSDCGKIYSAPLGDFDQWHLVYDLEEEIEDNISFAIHPDHSMLYILNGQNLYSLTFEGEINTTVIDDDYYLSGLVTDPGLPELYSVAKNSADNISGVLCYDISINRTVNGDPVWLYQYLEPLPNDHKAILQVLPDRRFLCSSADGSNKLYVYNLIDSYLHASYDLPDNVVDMDLDIRRIPQPEYDSNPNLNLLFGQVMVGECDTVSINIQNKGGSFLWLQGFTNDILEDYSLAEDYFPLTISAGESCDLKFCFAPRQNGPLTDTLFLKATDGISHEIRLFGIGYGGENVNDLENLPKEFALDGPYPNPFNPSTNLRISLPEKSPVSWQIVDLLGRTLVNNEFIVYPAGIHNLTINGKDLSSGMYFVNVKAGNHNFNRKMILVK